LFVADLHDLARFLMTRAVRTGGQDEAQDRYQRYDPYDSVLQSVSPPFMKYKQRVIIARWNRKRKVFKPSGTGTEQPARFFAAFVQDVKTLETPPPFC
jgi:hypothetical protein